MKRIARVSFFGIALAVVLSFGIPGNANAFDNGASGRIILVGVEAGFDIGGVGAGANIGGPDRDRYEREQAYEHERAKERAAHKRDVERDREHRDTKD